MNIRVTDYSSRANCADIGRHTDTSHSNLRQRHAGIRILSVALVAVMAAFPMGTTTALASAQLPARTQQHSLCDTSDTAQFDDVADNDYAAAYILCARVLGLAKGSTDGTYNPTSHLTRAQMASFLVRLWRDVLEEPCPTTPAHTFTDITGNTHETNIACLYALGITKGKNTAIYDPSANLTTAHITRFIARTLNKAKPETCPTQTGDELQQAATCLTNLNIAPSTTEAATTIPATRAQMALYLIGAWHHAADKGKPPEPPTYTNPDIPANTFTTISSGLAHTCAIRTDKTITCWGDNESGGTDVPAGQFTAITAGRDHSCAIKTNKTAICWGDNGYGWGDNGYGIERGKADPPTGRYTAITAGRDHSCAIKTNQTVICWGSNSNGQISTSALSYINATAVTAGGWHSCAIKTDQNAICWGNGQIAPAGRYTAITAAEKSHLRHQNRPNRHLLEHQP